MKKDAYSLEQSLRTRNTGMLMGLIVVPAVLVFMYIDHITPSLSGILGWRMVALVPSLLYLPFALFHFTAHRQLTLPLHIAQLAGVMVMMCGICAELVTRPEFPPFERSALISSLLVCIFADFVFAGGARRHLLLILVLPLAAMSVYIATVGTFLSQTEKLWLICNPSVMAAGLGVTALFQERSGRREFRARTELKIAEESLRQSEKKFRGLFHHAEIGMFRSRLDGSEMLDVNPKFVEIFGRSREEMVGRPSLVFWADVQERNEMVRILNGDARVTNYECGMLDARGEVHRCLISARLESDQGILEGSLVDVTERRHMEAERESMWQRLEFLLETTRTGLDIIDENFVVHYVDPARRKTMGDPKGRPCYEYFRGASVPCGDCAMRRALETKKVQAMEQTLPGEENRPTQVTAMPYRDGSRWMVAEVIVDIAERKQAEAERLDLERRIAAAQKLESLGILAGGIAHNFNNLLSVILGNAELLRVTLPAGSDSATFVTEIIKAGYRSRDLISQLLAMGRRQVLELRPLDLNEVVRACSTMLRRVLREDIDIDYRLSVVPCPIVADPGRIEDILLNLALNAQDAMAQEGRLVIATTEVLREALFTRRQNDVPAGRCIMLTVGDTGTGMDQQTMSRIFDPFFTTKEPGKGTGLGLSTVYGIVQQHGGSIEVDSQPGEGTRFRIYFPRTETPSPENRA